MKKKISLGNEEILFFLRALNRNKEKNVLGLIFKPHQLCTWPILVQFSQHSYLAQFSQTCQ